MVKIISLVNLKGVNPEEIQRKLILVSLQSKLFLK